MNKRDKEFQDHRTSWKWFERQFVEVLTKTDMRRGEAFFARLGIEILKELQYTNDKNTSSSQK